MLRKKKKKLIVTCGILSLMLSSICLNDTNSQPESTCSEFVEISESNSILDSDEDIENKASLSALNNINAPPEDVKISPDEMKPSSKENVRFELMIIRTFDFIKNTTNKEDTSEEFMETQDNNPIQEEFVYEPIKVYVRPKRDLILERVKEGYAEGKFTMDEVRAWYRDNEEKFNAVIAYKQQMDTLKNNSI